jgi:hypothetical protein
MNALESAKQNSERFESCERPDYAAQFLAAAQMYAAIAQAELLRDICQELARLGNLISLITSIEAEIIQDLRTRRAAERASYAAYQSGLAESQADEKTLPAEMPA